MTNLTPWIWLAGGIQLVIVAANYFLPKKLDYRGNLARVSTIVRQVFIIHSIYIVGVLAAFSALCLLFAPELAGASAMGRFMSAFFAIFWLARVGIQLFYYDPDLKRANFGLHVAFVAAIAYLGITFAVAALIGEGR